MSKPTSAVSWADMPAADLRSVDITSAAVKADPFPLYARLREEAPVQPVVWGRGRTAWLVSRYGDVEEVLGDPRLRKDATEVPEASSQRLPSFLAPLQRNLLGIDGPDHDRLRRLVHKAFTPRRIELMRIQVEQLSDELLDSAVRRGSVDVVTEFAIPLAVTVIARILGLPESDVRRFRSWMDAMLLFAERPLRSTVSMVTLMRYLRCQIAERAEEPRDDLISAMVEARDQEDRLSTDEILSMIVLLLTAGHETTVNLIGSGTLALLTAPVEAERLRSGAVAERTAVEELLRFTSPVETATERLAAEDLVIAGTTIPRGSLVLAGIASANRDPVIFPDADRLDLGRSPNPHLAFGKSGHYCLGAPLARLEAQIAVPGLLRRAPQLRLTDPSAPADWRPGAIVRGLRTLPVLL